MPQILRALTTHKHQEQYLIFGLNKNALSTPAISLKIQSIKTLRSNFTILYLITRYHPKHLSDGTIDVHPNRIQGRDNGVEHLV